MTEKTPSDVRHMIYTVFPRHVVTDVSVRVVLAS
jgi:hypothetical protein